MRLAVMRPADKLEGAIRLAESMGFEALAASPLRVQVRDSPEIDAFIEAAGAGKADAAVLTSTTGVDAVMQLLARRGVDDVGALLQGCQGIAIGPLTAGAMMAAGMKVDFVPPEYTSEGLVRSLASTLQGRRVFLLRSDHGERILKEGLEKAGAQVEEVVVYELVPQPFTTEMKRLAQESLAGRVDAFAFSSALSAATFIESMESLAPREEVMDMLNSRTVGAMGGPTRRKLEGMGIRVGAVPADATFEALLQAIRSAGDGPGAMKE